MDKLINVEPPFVSFLGLLYKDIVQALLPTAGKCQNTLLNHNLYLKGFKFFGLGENILKSSLLFLNYKVDYIL